MKFSHLGKSKIFYTLIYDLFLISLLFYLVFTWIDRAYQRYISDYFSLNIILVIVLFSGFFTVLGQVKKSK